MPVQQRLRIAIGLLPAFEDEIECRLEGDGAVIVISHGDIGGIGSILGTASFDWGGWGATCAVILTASLLNTFLTILAFMKWRMREA